MRNILLSVVLLLLIIFSVVGIILFPSIKKERDTITYIEEFDNRENLYNDCKNVYLDSGVKGDNVIRVPPAKWPSSVKDIGPSSVYIMSDGVSISFLGGHSLPLEVFYDPNDKCLYFRKNFHSDLYFQSE